MSRAAKMREKQKIIQEHLLDHLDIVRIGEDTFYVTRYGARLIPKSMVKGKRPRMEHWNNATYKREPRTGNLKILSRRHELPLFCKYYQRLGFCKNKDCRYIHDPLKIAVCKTNLLIRCRLGDKCLLSHEGTEYNLPHCKFYTQGRCTNSQCAYVHSDVTRLDYPVCRRFALGGWCYRGAQCKFRHVWECPDGENCPRGKQCKQQHLPAPAPVVPLEEIPSEDFLLPPLSSVEPLPDHWYGIEIREVDEVVSSDSSEDERDELDRDFIAF